jgi:inositol hexakisphosphate/diphosphoinositol-pentakisphosphate kinase
VTTTSQKKPSTTSKSGHAANLRPASQLPPPIPLSRSTSSSHVPKSSQQSQHKKNNPSKQIPHIPAAAEDAPAGDRIRLGICAMDKKARSKPMAEILSRLDEDLFQVVFFGDQVILKEPIENWPVVDVVIAFFSKGYPLNKAKEYVALRKPCTLNDLENQRLLQDRRRVYDLLEASGIDVPRHVYLSRDGYVSTGTGDGGQGNQEREIQEFDDHIVVNGVTIHKPFVEKPVDAEDHNIAIYYPTSAGGGCKKLFRKIGNRSSEFYPGINEVRRDGSFIYEEFVETQGTDVKMYTVGPEYGHAEARKSPTVDGKVERNSDGKEVRFPVILTFREKEIARRIVLVFKQFVCGFDILRVQEGHSVVSYVCDVNGWSFVKNSRYVLLIRD